ncbi:SsgA family sporulation/cell division regulator [Microtetraspora malaysiensis]|uniref:SsgA family sporulation/cell division regulator n=1 Tax=Microtetraspora malaysiensis TaxID=161358 RepID=UPI003D91A182
MSHPSFFRRSRHRTQVAVHCDATVRTGADISRPAAAVLHHTANDPHTVRMTVSIQGAGPSERVFDRSLLIEGIEVPTGAGLVKVWPAPQQPVPQPSDPSDATAADDLVAVELDTPGSPATVTPPAAVVRDFVEHIQRTVATGAESDLLNLDQVLAALLAGTGGPDDGTGVTAH